MKTWVKVLIAVVAVLFLLGLFVVSRVIGINNRIVTLDMGVKSAWGDVQNVYQRRADLIPNLVETVKGYAAHESGTFEAVTEARAKLGGVINLPPDAVNNPALMQKYRDAQASLGSALQRLMVVSENYPQLKANENFLSLQAQLEGTENRIAVARRDYNGAVKEYNTFIALFPNSIIAGFKRVKNAEFYAADAAAAIAPKVKF
ncbi:MAG: LemA family protein [Fibrobacterota bacterium]